MRVLVCGGRDFTDWMYFRAKMEEIAAERFPRTEPDTYGNFLYAVTIIHGAAKGADTLADQWAVVNWCLLMEFPAEWERFGRRAGYLRNKQMLEEGKPDLVIAFPGGKGTANMVKLAKDAGIETIIVPPKNVRDHGETIP